MYAIIEITDTGYFIVGFTDEHIGSEPDYITWGNDTYKTFTVPLIEIKNIKIPIDI